jgi:hypothetical protein
LPPSRVSPLATRTTTSRRLVSSPGGPLTFSAEFTYEHLDQKNAGSITTSGGYGTGTYTLKDQDTYQGLFRAQRNF